MSEMITVDVSNPDLFKPPEFPVIPPGIHVFVVAEMSEWAESKNESNNNKVKSLQFRCQDDDENKGLVVFERFVLVDSNDVSENAVKARKINQQAMATFCLACGVTTKDEILNTGTLPLDSCLNAVFKAETKVTTSTYQGRTQRRAEIKKYLY